MQKQITLMTAPEIKISTKGSKYMHVFAKPVDGKLAKNYYVFSPALFGAFTNARKGSCLKVNLEKSSSFHVITAAERLTYQEAVHIHEVQIVLKGAPVIVTSGKRQHLIVSALTDSRKTPLELYITGKAMAAFKNSRKGSKLNVAIRSNGFGKDSFTVLTAERIRTCKAA